MPFLHVDADWIIDRAQGRRIVVIAPHPDDETLGCGNLLASAARRRTGIAVIALTDGDASHPGSQRWPPRALAQVRAGELRRALARLGASGQPLRRFGWHDGHVATEGDVRRLAHALVALRAGIVLVTSDSDHHPDHKAASRLAHAAAHRLDLPVVEYAVWSRAEKPDRGRSRDRVAKRWAIAAHRSQVGAYIADDPDGFRLSQSDLANLVGGAETYSAKHRSDMRRHRSDCRLAVPASIS